MHTDARDDNFRITRDGRACSCDWNAPVVGAAWIDTVCLLMTASGDGLDADALLAERPLTRHGRPRRHGHRAGAVLRLLPRAPRPAAAALLAVPAPAPGLVRRGELGLAGPAARLDLTAAVPGRIWAAYRPAGIVAPRVSGCLSARSPAAPAPRALTSAPTHRTKTIEACPVANIKSQIKRNRQNDAAHERNKSVKSALKSAVRRFREAADAGDADEAKTLAAAAEPQARQGRVRRRHPQEPGGQQEVRDQQARRVALTQLCARGATPRGSRRLESFLGATVALVSRARRGGQRAVAAAR